MYGDTRIALVRDNAAVLSLHAGLTMKSRAFERLCEICPQMKDYHPEPDYFASALQWTPYTMFSNRKSYQCKAYCTDAYGIRITYMQTQPYTLDQYRAYQGRKAVLVGNSFAFGVGASSDRATVPSHLSDLTGTLYLNLGGRSHNSTQEVLNIVLNLDKLEDADTIVFLSGVNNIELFHSSIPRIYPPEWFFFQQELCNSLSRPVRVPLREVLRRALRLPGRRHGSLGVGRRGTDRDMNEPCQMGLDHEVRRDWFNANLRRDFALLKLLAQQYAVYYVLQPCAAWIRKQWTDEEQELFGLLDDLQPRRWQTVLAQMARDKEAYAASLRACCSSCGIQFVDLNEYFTEPKWFFVDRVHMNDTGYRKTAQLLVEHMLC
jgi:hypothetical protein